MATQWVEIDSAVMRDARTRQGLSYESLARQIPVAAKTYERWEKRGRVPLWHVDRVAELLVLEIERPSFEPPLVKVEAEPAPHLEELLERVIGLLEETLAQRPSEPKTAVPAAKRRG